MSEGESSGGLKWTHIPAVWAVVLVVLIVIIVFGSALYGPYRWKSIALSINSEICDIPQFAKVVAIPQGGVLLKGTVQTAKDLILLQEIAAQHYILPVGIRYVISVEELLERSGGDIRTAPATK